jgi:hypothetical protein
MGHYANFKAYEGSLSGAKLITFPWNVYRLVLTNDSNANMAFTFQEDAATLKPTESFSASLRVKHITLSGSGAYRLWVYG